MSWQQQQQQQQQHQQQHSRLPSSSSGSFAPSGVPLPSAAMASVSSSAGGAFPLESACRLSHSLLWDLQSSFYLSHGVGAWAESIVPNFITSNRAIAGMYAKIVLGFVSDVMAGGGGGTSGARTNSHGGPSLYDPAQPIYIVELGAGHGRFSFLVLQALVELEEFWPTPPQAAASSSASAASASSPPPPPFVYVLTDFCASNLASWSCHPSFAPFLRRGLVDFALLDAEDPGAGMTLQQSGVVLKPPGGDGAASVNPMAVIANYVLDTLRHDAFRYVYVPPSTTNTTPATAAGAPAAASSSSGYLQLQEGLISLTSPNEYEPDGQDPELLKRLTHTWTYRDVPGEAARIRVPLQPTTSSSSSPSPSPPLAYYSGRDASFNSILTALSHQFASCSNAPFTAAAPASSSSAASAAAASAAATTAFLEHGFSFLLPVGGLRCLEWFGRCARGNLVLLCGDKAHSALEELHGLRDPHLAIHGSFSMMVNFVALGLHFEMAGPSGAAAHTPYLDGFKVGLFARMKVLEGPDSAHRLRSAGPSSSSSPILSRLLRQTALAFHALRTFGPDQFSTLQRCIKEETPHPSLKHILSLLRLSDCDAEIFFKFRATLIDRVAAANAPPSAAPSGTAGGGASSAAGAPISDKVLKDLRADLVRIGQGHYPLSSSKDVSFELGRLAMGLHEYALGMQFFAASLVQCGDHHVTSYNFGLCAYYAGDASTALRHFERAVALNPEYAEAKEWAERVRQKMRQHQQHANRSQSSGSPPTATRHQHHRGISIPQPVAGVPSFILPTPIASSDQDEADGFSALSPSPVAVPPGLPFPFPTMAGLPFPSTTTATTGKRQQQQQQPPPGRGLPSEAEKSGAGSDHAILNTFVQGYRGYN